jgi:hypothetical protein
MGASRPRRVFAASFVITVAACSRSGKETGAGSGTAAPPANPFENEWSVVKYNSGCVTEAVRVAIDCPPGYSCNPPEPTSSRIRCPPGATLASRQRVVELPDATCAVVPRECNELSCATTKTSCPFTVKELSQLEREGHLDEDGHCSVSWIAPGDRMDWFIIPCPLANVTTFKVQREDFDKPCFASSDSLTSRVEIPCPVEPRKFASGKVFKDDYGADKKSFQGSRVQVIGYYLPAKSTTTGTVHTVAIANAMDSDVLALTCTTTFKPKAMKEADWIVVDGVVKDDPPSDVTLEDCAIWPREN